VGQAFPIHWWHLKPVARNGQSGGSKAIAFQSGIPNIPKVAGHYYQAASRHPCNTFATKAINTEEHGKFAR